MKELGFKDLYIGQIFDFGSITLNDEEIIAFAKHYDPMPFHINKEEAINSHFKGLIASGPHLFHIFYTQKWVPLFKNSVFAGRGINNWLLHKPVYSGTEVFCKVEVKTHVPKPERNFGVVLWYFEFTNNEREILQNLDLTVMHKL